MDDPVAPEGLFLGDNLAIMRGWPSACIDLTYMDPPFCTGQHWEGAAGAFSDRWEGPVPDGAPEIAHLAAKVHSPAMGAYLAFMAERLAEVRRLLKATGSLYVHCDDVADAYMKVLLDTLFGKSWFKNNLSWRKSSSGKNNMTKRFARAHDTILFYAGSKATFNTLYVPLSPGALKHYSQVDEDGRVYRTYHGGSKIHGRVNTKGQYRIYLDSNRGATLSTLWVGNETLIGSRNPERVGYPTQKPLALLDRIIRASSNEGDVVLDPFCGSGTTLAAAEAAGRRWVGIDAGEDAVSVCEKRLAVSRRPK